MCVCVCVAASSFNFVLRIPPPFLGTCSLQRSLLKAEEKIVALEQQLDRLLAGKNSTIEQLEAKVCVEG